MDFNNIEQRIGRLFISIKSHYESYKPVEPITEKKCEDDKEIYSISIGGNNPLSNEEEFDVFNKFIFIIHGLYNIKDNLKNYLKKRGFNDQLVENEINNSLHLQIIADLSNQDKHGYPLKNKRSGLDPKIENFQNSYYLNMPVGGISYDFMSGKVIHTADITDLNSNVLFTYAELIEKGIERWEDFLLNHVPEVCFEIIENRKIKNDQKIELNKIQHFINEVYLIFENSEWINIENDELTLGLIVKNIDNNIRGLIVNRFYDESSNLIITLLSDDLFNHNYHANKYRWQSIKTYKNNDLMILTHYFLTNFELRQKVETLR